MASKDLSIGDRACHRPPKLSPDAEDALARMYQTPGVKVMDVALAFQVSKQTVYNIVRRSEKRKLGLQGVCPAATTDGA